MSGISKSTRWLKNHMEITNVDKELVVPIMVTREEYQAFFSPDSKDKPEEGYYPFLKKLYEEQKPEAIPFGEAKKSTIHLKATYHPVAHGVSTQQYLPQKGQGEGKM